MTSEEPLSKASFSIQVGVQVATRTLVAAGFIISDFRRGPNHVEYVCERRDSFGIPIPYLIAICDTDEPVESDLTYARRAAQKENRVLVLVARIAGQGWLGWDDFIDTLGGAVPTWRALGREYVDIITVAAKNKKPQELSGEAWQIFEDAVADGLEFIFGHRVKRFGGHRRGQKISDMITRTPDDKILIVDTKASEKAYSVGGPEVRPLTEYVKKQKIRQKGRLDVSAALMVADQFEQDAERLQELSGEFLAETEIPLSFLEVSTLLGIIDALVNNPRARNIIRWAQIFCAGGMVLMEKFNDELSAAIRESHSGS
jgi:hypothetical protein